MIEKIRELVAIRVSFLNAEELMMADMKPSVTPTLSTRSDSFIKLPAVSVRKGNSIVEASNVLVRKQKPFLTSE